MARLNVTSTLFNKANKPTDGLGVSVTLEELIALRFEASHLTLANQRKLMSVMAGGYQSRFRGRGIDFAETRHYQPGDDVRSIDWRVTARTGHPHTKVYQEERERPVFLVVDYGPNMVFGTRVAFKSVVAARTAALLGWAAANHNDRVGGVIMLPQHCRDIRPAGGRRGVLKLLKSLADDLPTTFDISPSSDYLNRGLMQVRRVAHPGSLVCILSDFQSMDENSERHLKQLAQHTDVLAIFLYDALEYELPPPNQYTISDGKKTLRIDTGDTVFREQYHSYFEQRYDGLKTLFKQQGLHLLPVATHDSVAATLKRGLSRNATPLELSQRN
ncbi:MAG: DUF58 domain-containing protein [Pseudomonadota bacterium]